MGRRVDNDSWDIDNSVPRRKVVDHSLYPRQSVGDLSQDTVYTPDSLWVTVFRPQHTPQTVCG